MKEIKDLLKIIAVLLGMIVGSLIGIAHAAPVGGIKMEGASHTKEELTNLYNYWDQKLQDDIESGDYKEEHFNKLRTRIEELRKALSTSSPIEREWIIIDGEELITGAGRGIETLVTPEKMKAADELERRWAGLKLGPLVSVLKITNPTRYEAVNALYQATGFVGVRGRQSQGYNENSYRAQISRSRRMIREGIGDKEVHRAKIQRLIARLRANGVDAKFQEGEASSPITLRMGVEATHTIAGILQNILDLAPEDSKMRKVVKDYIVLFKILRDGWNKDEDEKHFVKFHRETETYSRLILSLTPKEHKKNVEHGLTLVINRIGLILPDVREQVKDREKWESIRVLLQGIGIARDARLNEIIHPMIMVSDYLWDGVDSYQDFQETFIMWMDYLADRDPRFKDRFEYIKELAASSPIGSTVHGGSYPIQKEE